MRRFVVNTGYIVIDGLRHFYNGYGYQRCDDPDGSKSGTIVCPPWREWKVWDHTERKWVQPRYTPRWGFMKGTNL